MAFSPRLPYTWRLRTCSLPLGGRTLLMGILNITPDSFSDGSAYYSPDLLPGLAADRAQVMLDEGADILDLGGESTRPDATPVTTDEECARILPVLEAVLRARPEAILSVDTYHAETARRALDYGVEIVNDVSGLMWDPAMAAVLGEHQPGVVLMHARGTPRQWATLPPLASDDVLPTIIEGLAESVSMARGAGLEDSRMVIDPGFGFGKRGEENYVLHAQLGLLRELALPVLVGTSRKRFLRGAAAAMSTEDRLSASTASNVAAILAGAHVLRVHDVAAARAAAAVADCILAAHVAVD